MDTVLIKNKSFHFKSDTIQINADYSQITTQLDNLIKENRLQVNELKESIQLLGKNERLIDYVSNDALFTTITTIIVFTLGVLINQLINRIKRERHKSTIRRYVKHHLDNITTKFTSTIQTAYTKFATETSIDNGLTLTPPKILSNNFKRVLNINDKELHDSVRNKKAISNVRSQIEFMDNLFIEVQEYHSHALKKSNEFREKLHDDLNSYFDSLAEFLDYEEGMNSDFMEGESCQFINEKILLYYNEMAGKRTLERFFKEILRPIQEYLIKTELYRTHLIGKQIASQGKNITHLYSNLALLTEEIKAQYKEFASYVENSNTALKEEVEKIKW
jgi:hypothetical protein